MKKIVLLYCMVVLSTTATFAATPTLPVSIRNTSVVVPAKQPSHMWCGVYITGPSGCYLAGQQYLFTATLYGVGDWDANVVFTWEVSADNGATWVDLHRNDDSCYILPLGGSSDLLIALSVEELTPSMPAYPFGVINAPYASLLHCGGLPITLLSFSGEYRETRNTLFWETANEINVDHIDVQRSNDGKVFTTLTSVLPKGVNTPYSYEDITRSSFVSVYYYRLLVVDNNDTYSTSAVIKVSSNKTAGTIKIGPNPASSYIDIGADGMHSGDIITIVDIAGRTVVRSSYGTGRIDVSRLVAGIYFTTIQGQSLRFFKK